MKVGLVFVGIIAVAMALPLDSTLGDSLAELAEVSPAPCDFVNGSGCSKNMERQQNSFCGLN